MLSLLDELTIEQQTKFPEDVRRGDRSFTSKESELYGDLFREWTYKKAKALLKTLRRLTPEHQAWFPDEVWRGERGLTAYENQMLQQFGNEEAYAKYGVLMI
jgi:hypothetical protein